MTLTKDFIHSLFEYKDGNLIWKVKNTKGKEAGALRPTGYVVVEIDSKPVMAHWLVWIMHNGNFDGYIDHIDGNRSNNKIGIKGVRVRKDSSKYEARITVNKKRIVLGSYKDLELAELVMIMAREKYHGVYAKHG